MNCRFQLSFLVALSALVIIRPLCAHHGFFASYDVAKRITLKGTVTQFAWSNPHAQIYFDAKDEAGHIVNWTGEMNSPGVLTKNGWSRNSMKPRDQIAITIVPSRAPGAHLGLAVKVVLPNGQVLEGNQGLRP